MKNLVVEYKGQVKAAASGPGDFIATILNASTSVHFLHFRTKSFSKHEALGDLYSGLVSIADTLTESYQGRHQVILDFPVQSVTVPTDELSYVLQLHKYVLDSRYAFAPVEETELQNILDELVSLIDKAAYKLKFLA